MSSNDEDRFLSLLPQDGTAMGNIKLQRLLGWDEERYAAVKARLRQLGLISLGQGKGGSVRLVEADVFTLLEELPPNGARITISKLRQRLDWNDTRFINVVDPLVNDGIVALGPRNTISIVLTPDVEEWLLRCVLPEGPAAVFDVEAVAVQLGWAVADVWRVRARLMESELQEKAPNGHRSRAREKTRTEERVAKAADKAEPLRRDETGQGAVAVEVFVAYARADEEWRKGLDKHLTTIRRSGAIRDWSDQQVLPGQEWSAAIREKLDRAAIVLLLVSADFLESDHCYDVEMQRALDRHEAGDARVIPVIVRRCDWQGTRLGKLQALPKDAHPISLWSDKDEAFYSVVEGIKKILQELKIPQGEINSPRRTRNA